jgi:hypothetical protein
MSAVYKSRFAGIKRHSRVFYEQKEDCPGAAQGAFWTKS